ncbi:aspartate/methionine/tyrosine aminotransferase [Inquilinus ginsengisoli]|uniref:aminotransferase class I/II-fold pyridoxal phosphate-dependent enzyme n=1 Tax=Inquilinus ginsengisoli TaxID=363840 RepID=UPI003D225F36
MTFQPFELEHWQSEWEHTVEYNLADSSVRCAAVREVLRPDTVDRLLDQVLFYPQVNGTDALRARIAGLYDGATADQVLVTAGASEANQILCQTLLSPGDEIVVMEPGYRQVWGIARNLGCTVKSFPLLPDDGWRPDLDALEAAVGPRTRMIAIVNPNNPTGSILTAAEAARITAIAAKASAWLHVDEVYRGTERLADTETPSFWGGYARTVVVGSLSKAYGLAGLRVGWLLGPKALVEDAWRRHEYVVIATAGPSMLLAELALEPATRTRLMARQRELSRRGWEGLERWIGANSDLVSAVPPAATALGFVRVHLDLSSVAVADAIRRRSSVLVAPGVYLGAEHHLRITHGYEHAPAALDRIATVLRELKAGRS